LKIGLGDAANEEYVVVNDGNVLQIRSREPIAKENFGQYPAKKRTIEISGASVPLELHAFEAQVQLTSWASAALLHIQRGKIIAKDGTASLTAHSQTGEISILNHQGPVAVDAYKSNVTLRDLTGDGDIDNFSGETLIDKAKGFLSLTQGAGTTKVLASTGTLQFEVVKGVMSIQKFQGRVEGQTQEGPVTVIMAPETEVNLKAQSGRVTVDAPHDSGAALNLVTQEGDIYVPNYLKVNRDGSQKTLRAHLKGDSAKGSIFIRSQEGSIFIR
jgi:DUF4097 and DUF4098 domain-containing protein YvlB